MTIITATLPGGILQTLVVDAITQEGFKDSSVVTEHPVEIGSDVTDHQRPESETLDFQCIVTNTPLDGAGSSFPESRSESAIDTLLSWREQGALLSIPTTFGTRDQLAIVNLSWSRDAKTGGRPYFTGGVRFQLSLKKIRIVYNSFTQVVVSKDPRVGNTVATGTQATVAVDAEPQSVANRLATITAGPLKALGGLFDSVNAGGK